MGSKDEHEWVATVIKKAKFVPNTFHILHPNVQYRSDKIPSQLGGHPIPVYLNNNR